MYVSESESVSVCMWYVGEYVDEKQWVKSIHEFMDSSAPWKSLEWEKGKGMLM